jgi:hypothetical protein
MIGAILLGITGFISVCVGVLAMISTAMPSFGGRRGNETGVFIFGAVLSLAGIASIFCAGLLV